MVPWSWLFLCEMSVSPDRAQPAASSQAVLHLASLNMVMVQTCIDIDFGFSKLQTVLVTVSKSFVPKLDDE